jgi:glutamyl-Q tRNA(Asp) synthetase
MEDTTDGPPRAVDPGRTVGSTDRAALIARLRAGLIRPLTRFAPAPTGFLHLGHVVNAIFVWGVARAAGGRVLLRIEDHDRQRCRPDYEQALLDDLDWLGFEPDIFSTTAFRSGSCEGRQSERDTLYRRALAPLIERGLVYGCDCSRKSLDSVVYPGTCRNRRLPLNDDVGWRLRVDKHDEAFDDGLLGWQRQSPHAQCGDLLLRDRLGNWTYQWAATTDDWLQHVTLVIRGVDLLESTGRQIYLARLLGRTEPPLFVHHPLVMKSATQKLSKADGDTGVRDLRASGWSAARVIGHAAALIGLCPASTDLSAAGARAFFEAHR